MPARTSSNMIPQPLGSDSTLLIGHGFNISKILNIKNANINHSHVLGKRKQVTHKPTYSSQTTFPGSGLLSVDRIPVAQIPTTNPTTIIDKKIGEPLGTGSTQYIKRAAAVPKVPGAIGESPTPDPVPINHATFFKYVLHNDDNEVNNVCSNP